MIQTPIAPQTAAQPRNRTEFIDQVRQLEQQRRKAAAARYLDALERADSQADLLDAANENSLSLDDVTRDARALDEIESTLARMPSEGKIAGLKAVLRQAEQHAAELTDGVQRMHEEAVADHTAFLNRCRAGDQPGGWAAELERLRAAERDASFELDIARQRAQQVLHPARVAVDEAERERSDAIQRVADLRNAHQRLSAS